MPVENLLGFNPWEAKRLPLGLLLLRGRPDVGRKLRKARFRATTRMPRGGDQSPEHPPFLNEPRKGGVRGPRQGPYPAPAPSRRFVSPSWPDESTPRLVRGLFCFAGWVGGFAAREKLGAECRVPLPKRATAERKERGGPA